MPLTILSLDQPFKTGIMNEEIWKDIPGYETYYQASNQGRVRSIDRYIMCFGDRVGMMKGRILKPKKNKYGYLRVNLSVNQKVKCCNIHKLVALTFIPNPENKDQINHWNGIKTDNNVDNICWATSQENNLHAHRVLHIRCSGTDRCGVKNPNSKPVVKCLLNGNIVEEYPCIEWAAKSINYSRESILKSITQGCMLQRDLGFIWKFKNQIYE